MPPVFLKITGRILFTIYILFLPLSVSAQTDNEFPYHVPRTVQKEMTCEYAFEDVWDTAMNVIMDRETSALKALEGEGLDSVRTRIKSDRSSGLISLYVTHKGKSGLFSQKDSLFHYEVLFLEPLGPQRTQAYVHDISFFSYDNYVFNGKQDARYVDLTHPSNDILIELLNRLKEKHLDTP